MAKAGKRKRSIAAKRGWETRRKNALRDKGRQADRKDPVTRQVQDESMRGMMIQAGLKVPKRISHRALLERFLDFVGAQRDAIVIAEAGRARAEEEVKVRDRMMPMVANRAIKETVARLHELGGMPDGWEDDEYHIIRSRMSMAAEFGDPMEEAERLADEYNMSPSEVYTVWLSP